MKKTPHQVRALTRLLAPLKVGDQIPWRLDSDGEPQWLTVIEVVTSMSYVVRYPDGTTELLLDSEWPAAHAVAA